MHFKKHMKLVQGQYFDIAPLIDVVFLLLIFFMLTSSFVFQPGIKINLPKAITSEVIQQKNIIILVNKDDTLYYEQQPITEDQLKKKLIQASKDKRPVLIKADTRARLGKVVEIWDLCRQLGISQVNLATSAEK